MPPAQLIQASDLLHGWPGLLSAYLAVEGPLLAGLIRGRAPLRQLLLSPLLAAPLLALSEVTVAATSGLLGAFGLGAGSLLRMPAAVALTAAIGYAAGRTLTRRAPAAVTHQRGALVAGAAPAARVRPDAGRGARARSAAHGNRRHQAVTLAGLAVAAEDETKHFKLIGTTGTGKSTAIASLMQGALRRGDRAVIADPDGGYLAR